MALKTFKPYTKSTRGTILVDRTGLWKGKPFKSLVSPKNSMKGRNNNGHITNINRAGGHKKCTDMLIFTEKNLIWRRMLKELSMTQIDHATSC